MKTLEQLLKEYGYPSNYILPIKQATIEWITQKRKESHKKQKELGFEPTVTPDIDELLEELKE